MTLDEAIEQYHELAKTFDTPEYVEGSASIFQVVLWLQELKRLRVERDEYKDIATKLCDKMTDCIYCPYEPDKANERCKLWKMVNGDD